MLDKIAEKASLATGRFYEQVHAPCALVQESMETAEMVGLIGRMTAVLAMRLHVLIFAASRGVPLAAVSYDPKVASFLDYLSQRNYVEYEALASPEQLYVLIDAAMRMDRAALDDATERIRAIESRNPETARRLLQDGERGSEP